MKTYEILSDTQLTAGGVDYAFETGDVTPKDKAEDALLGKLVAFGFARVKKEK